MIQGLRGWSVYSELELPFHLLGFLILAPKDWGKLIGQLGKVLQFVHFLASESVLKSLLSLLYLVFTLKGLHLPAHLLYTSFPQRELLVLAFPNLYWHFLSWHHGLFKSTQRSNPGSWLGGNWRSLTELSLLLALLSLQVMSSSRSSASLSLGCSFGFLATD